MVGERSTGQRGCNRHLLYEYKSTNTDAEGALCRAARRMAGERSTGQRDCNRQFARFTSTRVQILTQKVLSQNGGRAEYWAAWLQPPPTIAARLSSWQVRQLKASYTSSLRPHTLVV
jgi:hypothetical protein